MTDIPAKESPSSPDAERHGLTESFLAILICPVDRGQLEVVAIGLRCQSCGRVYTVENGIPNFVVDE
jgi:uncharacterized protein YbaR (Trm112 family)